LENGKITEQGNHKELVKIPGYYRRVYDLQYGGENTRVYEEDGVLNVSE
jgi:subfamily B ATP-binding cassette protein MsbA